MKRILFIGRFQPFHLGHLSVIEDIASRNDVQEIIIGIGSSQYSNTEENPYSLQIREEMINRILFKKIKKPYQIIAIPDINDNALWVDHVIDLVGKIDEIYTGNSWVANLFKEKNYVVQPINMKIDITGTKLREMIKAKNQNWQKYVAPNIYNLIGNE